jgi:hypothetical protein
VQSRVSVSASIDLINTSATAPARASCTARRSPDGSNDLSLFDAGPTVVADLHQADVDSSADGFVTESLSITGSVLLDAGTYDLGVDCKQVAGGGALVLYSAAMNVMAVPASS